MSMHKTYEDAHSAACTLARLLRRDVGLGKLKTYEGDNYEVFSLPSPERRFGRDATCQVVTRDEPRMANDPNVMR